MSMLINVAGALPKKRGLPPLRHWAIGLGMVLFVSHVLPLLILEPIVARAPAFLVPLGMIFGFWRFILSALLLGHLWSYLLVCGGVLVLAVAALWQRRGSHWEQVLLGLVLASTLWFMLAPYQPAVTAADDGQMVVATAPILPLRGLKQAQAGGEVKPCDYALLGWQGDTLFYRSNCAGRTTHWQFQPETMNVPQEHRADLPASLQTTAVPHTDVLDSFSAMSVYPSEAERSVRSLAIQGNAMVSPEGEWLAVVARHIYGAEDVILVKTQAR